MKWLKPTNRILLGLLMLFAGLLKLFVSKPAGVTQMLSGFGFPLPMVFAWILIILEIVSGIMILANWKTKYAAWAPAVILFIAAFMAYGPWKGGWTKNWSSFFFHLIAVSNYLWLIGMSMKAEKKASTKK